MKFGDNSVILVIQEHLKTIFRDKGFRIADDLLHGRQ